MKRTPIQRNSLLFGDCLEWLALFPDGMFTAVVTDPPYGLSGQPDMREVLKHWLAGDDYSHRGGGFMGCKWDSFVPGPKVWEEVMRALKPGGHILSFSGSRTYDLMVTAMRLASLEIRDKIDFYCEMERQLSWTYGSGFPKSLNIGKAIDKASRGVPQGGPDSTSPNHGEFKGGCDAESPTGQGFGAGPGRFMKEVGEKDEREVVPDAKKWEGYGTALKPAHEPMADFSNGGEPLQVDVPFRYVPKVSTRERNLGCGCLFWKTVDGRQIRIEKDEYDHLQAENEANKENKEWKRHHIAHGNCFPTVKPLELMRYLVRLVKMPGDNFILDPFAGSCTTACACILEGCDFIAIDNDPVAREIAEARIHYFKCLGEKGLK